MHSIHATVHAYIQAPGTICKWNRQHYISALFFLSVVGSWVDPSANQCVGCSTPNCFHHELAMLLAAAPGHDHVDTCLSGSAQRRKPNWWQWKQYRDWNVAWNDSAISAVKTLMVSRGTGCWILYIQHVLHPLTWKSSCVDCMQQACPCEAANTFHEEEETNLCNAPPQLPSQSTRRRQWSTQSFWSWKPLLNLKRVKLHYSNETSYLGYICISIFKYYDLRIRQKQS